MPLNTEVSPTPSVSITPANSSVQLGSNFTLMMVDADAVGTDESAGQTRHWLVNGVTLSNGTVYVFVPPALSLYPTQARVQRMSPHPPALPSQTTLVLHLPQAAALIGTIAKLNVVHISLTFTL